MDVNTSELKLKVSTLTSQSFHFRFNVLEFRAKTILSKPLQTALCVIIIWSQLTSIIGQIGVYGTEVYWHLGIESHFPRSAQLERKLRVHGTQHTMHKKRSIILTNTAMWHKTPKAYSSWHNYCPCFSGILSLNLWIGVDFEVLQGTRNFKYLEYGYLFLSVKTWAIRGLCFDKIREIYIMNSCRKGRNCCKNSPE